MFLFKNLLFSLTVIILYVSTLSLKNKIEIVRHKINENVVKNQNREALYIPNGNFLEFISLGYKNAFSDLLWFQTISYFGQHYKTDKSYLFLYHFCDLITSLNPKKKYVYEFGSTMLAWENHSPELSIKLLDKAILNFPEDWKLYFIRGFTKMFFLNQNEEAKKDFQLASQLPDCSNIVKRLAEKDPKSYSKKKIFEDLNMGQQRNLMKQFAY